MGAEKFFKDYSELQSEVSGRFSELLTKNPKYDLLGELEEDCDFTSKAEQVESTLTLVEVRNSFTGTVRDFYFKGADENGIYVLDTESFDESLISFHNLSSLYDMIVVLELMEEQL
jgi:hypothetical protein